MTFRTLCIAGGLLAASAMSANAADPAGPGADEAEYRTPSGWTFTVAPYGWFVGLGGDIGARGRTTHIDASIGDVLSDLDFAAMAVAEARYERFGIFTDVVYSAFSDSANTPFGVLASSVDVTTQYLMWTAAAEYRLLDRPTDSIDAFAGFRLYSLTNELDFNSPGLIGGTEVSQTETWADPIVGLKGRYAIAPEIYLTGWGMVGGGASSDLVWDVMGGAGYRFTTSFSAMLGYRASGVDYTDNGFVFDTVQQGPVVGALFRF